LVAPRLRYGVGKGFALCAIDGDEAPGLESTVIRRMSGRLQEQGDLLGGRARPGQRFGG
jgi:hypothetical protein